MYPLYNEKGQFRTQPRTICQEGRREQVRTIKGRIDNETQVKVMGEKSKVSERTHQLIKVKSEILNAADHEKNVFFLQWVFFKKVDLGSAHLLKLQSEDVLVRESLQQGAKRKEVMKPWGQPQLRVAPTAVWQQGSEAFLATQLCQSKAVSALCISLIMSEITLPIEQILALLSSLTLLSSYTCIIVVPAALW